MPVLTCSADGKKLRNDHDAVELIGEALHAEARIVLISAERLDEDFFLLRTRIAGEFIQKFVTYGVRLAIVCHFANYLA